MIDGYIVKVQLSGFEKREDEGLAKAALIRLGISHFSMDPTHVLSFITFMPQMDLTQWGSWQTTMDQLLAPLCWLFETEIKYIAEFQSIPSTPQLVSNSFGGNSIEISISSTEILETKEGTAMSRWEPLEELLCSSLESDRQLGLLILGLDLEPIKEKAMRFKQANDFTV